MEGEIMFNLLYMKYQKEIMRPYRGKFKDLHLYEKIFLIVLISDASLFAVFSFLNNKIGSIVTFAIILFLDYHLRNKKTAARRTGKNY